MHNSQSSKKINKAKRQKKRLVRSHHSWYFPSGDAVPGAGAEEQEQSLPWLWRREKPRRGQRTSTSKQCLCSHPPPHPCMKEAALLCPKKGLEGKNPKQPNQTAKNTQKNPTMTLKTKCQGPFPRAESHQQVGVGQFCSDLVLTSPQPC